MIIFFYGGIGGRPVCWGSALTVFVVVEWNDSMMFTGVGEVCNSGGVLSGTESALLRRPASVHVSEVH